MSSPTRGPTDPTHAEKSSDSTKPTKKRSKSLARELQFLVDNNGKRAKRDQPKCPICQLRIDPKQWEQHYQLELRRLDQVQSDVYEDPINKSKGKKRGAAVVARQQLERSTGKKKAGSVYEETLEKIQRNRDHRNEKLRRIDNSHLHPTDAMMQEDQALALSQALLEEGDDIQTCFICNETLHGDLEAINLHIDSCLANMNNPSSSHTNSSNDNASTPETTEPSVDTGGWDEYEWAGQRRVRATAMMDGGYGGAGFATTSKREEDEEDDEDLDVEDDDAEQYGQTQYTERDIYAQDETEDDSALREMVSGASGSGTRQSSASVDSPRSGFEETVSDEGWKRSISSEQHLIPETGHSRLVIESLKSRIHQLEVASRSAPRCLICLEPYKTPVTSIVCWHVHCEQCWLQTLGSKKLCPQCQKITTPADLRRIYL
ncbi:hypothetical protein BDA99DRAFT_514669 [Phascolomyces articulosus]|uniref:RING-type domain-containing protein n=1 Tax=Phascolomyces articulosus TaxID=60185 RepID=A0AAD5JXE2_9FUNG|nr:hypothetical protein BDA99DRAFT_514669 [Phascolomyces articulosus]